MFNFYLYRFIFTISFFLLIQRQFLRLELILVVLHRPISVCYFGCYIFPRPISVFFFPSVKQQFTPPTLYLKVELWGLSV